MPWSNAAPRSTIHGTAHANERKARAAVHDPYDPCVRCGHPLGPMGPHLHLDHHDHDKARYLGFSHGRRCPVCGKSCNLRAAALKANANRKAARMGYTTAVTERRL